MNGAEVLLRSLVNSGVEVCFTNPGTSEMQFVAAMDRAEGMRSILVLFEGVASGAADGYGRMAGRPASTLFHLGPGLANGLANLHNAMRARTPIVNVVGDHATYHRQYDAPLTSDIPSYARPVSGWIHSTEDARDIAADTAAAVAAARKPPGSVATLIAPADCTWNPAGEPAGAAPVEAPASVDEERLKTVATALRKGEPAVILMNGQALLARGLEAASRVANHTGAKLMCDTFTARMERGAGRPPIERLHYFGELAQEQIKGAKHLVLVGSKPPVSFFAYPDAPSWLTPDDCEIHRLAHPGEDAIGALEALAEELDAPRGGASAQGQAIPEPASGELTADTVAQSVAAYLPEGTIVSDEAATSGLSLGPFTAGAPPHDWLSITGGAIGQGLPVGVGAAVACPDRKVLCLQADGSAMYTLQALWTMARENLDVTVVIYSNREYRILQIELDRVGGGDPGPKAMGMLDIGQPELDFVSLARGLGVEAVRVGSIEEFNKHFRSAMAERGPRLIDVPIA